MRTIIAGGRYYRLTKEDFFRLDVLRESITEVVSGGCSGVDSDGEDWARLHGIPIRVFAAQWSKYGRYAGPLRNKQMAQYAEQAVLFPGGAGTDSMHKEAVSRGLKIHDHR